MTSSVSGVGCVCVPQVSVLCWAGVAEFAPFGQSNDQHKGANVGV